MKRLQHKNIVTLHEVIDDPVKDCFYMVQEVGAQDCVCVLGMKVWGRGGPVGWGPVPSPFPAPVIHPPILLTLFWPDSACSETDALCCAWVEALLCETR